MWWHQPGKSATAPVASLGATAAAALGATTFAGGFGAAFLACLGAGLPGLAAGFVAGFAAGLAGACAAALDAVAGLDTRVATAGGFARAVRASKARAQRAGTGEENRFDMTGESVGGAPTATA